MAICERFGLLFINDFVLQYIHCEHEYCIPVQRKVIIDYVELSQVSSLALLVRVIECKYIAL